MSSDLDRLAARIAAELARRDAPKRGAPQGAAPTVPTPAPAGWSRAADAAGPSVPSAKAPPGVSYVRDQARIADFIDHTLLKPEATRSEVEKLCSEAATHRFAAVCVNPVWVPLCVERLRGSPMTVATFIGYPRGA